MKKISHNFNLAALLNHKRFSNLASLACLGVALGLAGCSASADEDGADPSSDGVDPGADGADGADDMGGVIAATITSVDGNLAFMPADIVIKAGDTVQFVNSETHNALEVSGETYGARGVDPIPNGFEVDFGQTGTVTFDQPGRFFFVCTPHVSLNMIGTITVE